MSKKTTYIHAENNNKTLSSNEVRLYVPPEPEKMKVLIWGKELCNMAEWNDFLKCVEEKTEENKQLKQQLAESFTEEDVEGLIEDRDKTIKFLQKELAEKDKEIERYKQELEQTNAGYDFIYEQSGETINELKQLAIQKLEKVKDYFILEHEDGSLDITKNEFEIAEYLITKIKELKGE